jgi:hypothetical protein
MMKVDDSVESLVHFLVHSVSPGNLVKAAKGNHGIGSDDSGCGVNYPDPNDPEPPTPPPGQVRLYYFWGPRHGGYEAVTSKDEYLRVLANALRAASATDAADQIDEIRKGRQTSRAID